ncbi:MAG: hypothetical protein ABS82_00335 [Rhodanobacter sp. SCN 67-45]|nr:MAG: hypothetical protein ABS82_00335 [Rhodanobacter sp. SCN 67-45]
MNVEITIRRTGDEVEVLQGEATTGRLCPGEVIEQVLALVFPGMINRAYPMRTPDEWAQLRGNLRALARGEV